jgi:xanthine dehydrogenase/oxidase
MAPRVQAALEGQPWTGATLDKALAAVAEDVNITPNAPGKLLRLANCLRGVGVGKANWASLCPPEGPSKDAWNAFGTPSDEWQRVWGAGGMVEFRRSLAASFLFRFFVEVALKLEAEVPNYCARGGWLPAGHESAAVRFERPPSQGMQYFTKVDEQDVVGQPSRHMAADLQVCEFMTGRPS